MDPYNINQTAQFPNIDQLQQEARDIYIHEHEFEAQLVDMVKNVGYYIEILKKYETEESISDPDKTANGIELEYYNARVAFNKAISLINKFYTELQLDITKKLEDIDKKRSQIDATYERLKYAISQHILFQNANIIYSTKNFNILLIFERALKRYVRVLLQKNKVPVDTTVTFDSSQFAKQYRYYFGLEEDRIEKHITIDVVLNPSIGEKNQIPNYFDMIVPLFSYTSEVKDEYGAYIDLSIQSDIFNFKGKMIKDNGEWKLQADFAYNNDSNISLKLLQNKTDKEKLVVGLYYNSKKLANINFAYFFVEAKVIVGGTLKTEYELNINEA